MNFVLFNCKIYFEADSEYELDYRVDSLFLDIDLISAFHATDDKQNTIVYCDGVSHELLISLNEFAALKCGVKYQAPTQEGIILMFSRN